MITYDEMLRRPSEARARLGHWLHGAGGDQPEQGMQMLPRATQPEIAEVCRRCWERLTRSPCHTTRLLTWCFGGRGGIP